MKTLTSYLPDPHQKTSLIQARVSPELAAKVKELAKLTGWKPAEIVRAGLMKFIDEHRNKLR